MTKIKINSHELRSSFNKQKTCLNCGELLTQEEIEHDEGWCSDCNLPEGDPYD